MESTRTEVSVSNRSECIDRWSLDFQKVIDELKDKIFVPLLASFKYIVDLDDRTPKMICVLRVRLEGF